VLQFAAELVRVGISNTAELTAVGNSKERRVRVQAIDLRIGGRRSDAAGQTQACST
jgi:hypothetical protein